MAVRQEQQSSLRSPCPEAVNAGRCSRHQAALHRGGGGGGGGRTSSFSMLREMMWVRYSTAISDQSTLSSRISCSFSTIPLASVWAVAWEATCTPRPMLLPHRVLSSAFVLIHRRSTTCTAQHACRFATHGLNIEGAGHVTFSSPREHWQHRATHGERCLQ